MNRTVKEIGKKIVAGIPTRAWLSYKFKQKMGYPMDWKNPKTFNQKLQWLKVYDRNPLYTTLVDKYEVKKYVSDKIGDQHIIPTLGVWDKFDEINFDSLPDQFVLKCTHDSGGLVIVRDKSKFDKESAREMFRVALNRNPYSVTREWPYKNVKPRIIAEQYMEDENDAAGLTDYKFFCFNGKPEMLYVSQGLEDHSTASISFFDMEGKSMPFHRSDFKPIGGEITLPSNFKQMKETASKMAKEVGCPFVRIDLYSVRGQMYFSEVTFSPCSGMLPFEPKDWDYTLGGWIKLPSK